MSHASQERAFRWQRFGQLRRTLLLALVAVATVAVGIWYGFVEPYRMQKSAIEAVGRMGGSVVTEPGGPAWLRALWGDDSFLDVVEVHFKRRLVEKDALRHLAPCRNLRRLYLASSDISDSDLRHIRNLTKLQRISFWRTSITDEGLKHLRNMPHLQALDIQFNRNITSAGLKHLHPQVNLSYLRASQTNLDDEAMPIISGMDRLQHLQLSYTNVTSEGVAALKDCLNLKHLELRKIKLDAKTLAMLSDLPRLSHLDIAACQLDDPSLEPISRCRTLQTINVAANPITDEALEHFRGCQQLDSVNVRATLVSYRGSKKFSTSMADSGRVVTVEPWLTSRQVMNYRPRLDETCLKGQCHGGVCLQLVSQGEDLSLADQRRLAGLIFQYDLRGYRLPMRLPNR